MASKKKTQASGGDVETVDFRHSTEKRKNIPPAKIAAEGAVPKVPKARYHYSPHLPPVLRSDPTGKADKLPGLIAAAGKRPLTPEEQGTLANALRTHEPWLEWATKREQHERDLLEVDPVALHIHERVSAQAIVRVALREDVQRDLFADPQQPYQQAVQFYKHDMDWANRLILGDSLQVMSSLARRENLAGKVQMIFMDPPYGIRFGSNFQVEVGNREVGEKETDLTREPETIRAFRDTWALGRHTYLTYLRDRLIVARDLLATTGSVFVQIGEENVHHVREVMDEVFGPSNAVVTIVFKKKGATTTTDPVNDYLLWYAKDRAVVRVNPIYEHRGRPEDDPKFNTLIGPDGRHVRVSPLSSEAIDAHLQHGFDYARVNYPLVSQHPSPTRSGDFVWNGRPFACGANAQWRFDTEVDMRRLGDAERLFDGGGKSLGGVMRWDDWPHVALTNLWDDLHGDQDPIYVVQTNRRVVARCLWMTTAPGDLVLDPMVGSGTTAFVAEQYGRRWIAMDTSRVAVALTRQRMLTSRFDHYRVRANALGRQRAPDPGKGFVYRQAPRVKLKQIAKNRNLDPILERHAPVLKSALATCNTAVKRVSPTLRTHLLVKLRELQRRVGKRAVTEADRRRWELPAKFEHWTVPFDADEDWPEDLKQGVKFYRDAWHAKMDEVNACVAANAEQEDLVHLPEVLPGVVRVSGPYSIEGVRPEELAMGDHGLFDPTPNEFEEDAGPALKNVHAYLTRMVQLLRQDGVTFLNNKRGKFSRIEPLFEQATGTIVHAEGAWETSNGATVNSVAVGFGPQFGPVTAQQVEELVRASRRYDELVVAGFSFDAAACAAIQEAQHPKLRIHQAYIRPDVNPGMDGLLKDTANSQLFTVFGQPDVEVKKAKTGEFEVHLNGVDVYDPVANTIRSTGADKVAAWFLDGDFDGRCFCITQAFFPDKSAWEKIAKALKTAGDAFDRFTGTVSVPFPAGKHRRVAVKVIDPRGNEVMALRNLPE